MDTPRTLVVVTVAAVFLASSAPALAQNYPVDDFEILPFDVTLAGPGGLVDTQTVPPPLSGHLLSQSRKVQCTIGGNGSPAEITRAWLFPGDSNNDAMTAWVSAHGNVAVFYAIGYQADVTAGGAVDRIEIDGSGSVGAVVRVGLKDASLTNEISNAYLLSSSTEIPLNEFTVVDLQNITEISLHLWDEGSYTIREIRLRGAGSEDMKYSVLDESIFTPPLPSPPMRVRFFDRTFTQALYQLDIGITDADAGFPPDLALDWMWATAFEGWVGGTSLRWTDPAPFASTQFSFSFGVSPANGWFPDLYPPDPTIGPEGMTLVFPIMMRTSPGGSVAGVSETWLTIGPGPGQDPNGLSFDGVTVTPNPVLARGTSTDGFTVSFLLQAEAAGVETNEPILEMTWWGDWNPNVATDIPALPVVATERLSLSVVPSVTRHGAEIRASSPFARGAEILVHDVRGRRVSALPAPAGERSARWDGRDGAGRPLPGGVYFVRLVGAPGATARVVKLR